MTPVTTAVLSLPVSIGLGCVLGRALLDRLVRSELPRVMRGLPIRFVIALSAALPFAVVGGWQSWLAATLGWALGLEWTSRRNLAPHIAQANLVDAIDRVLPQTQCGQCNYPGCRPYAEAIASGVADINQCPPGGEAGVRKLAELLGREPKPLNPANGIEKPSVVALIVEEDCIGCTKCIQACPVDAIVGAPKRMHTVVADLCTGCELCLPPCPVDCIVLVPPGQLENARVQV